MAPGRIVSWVHSVMRLLTNGKRRPPFRSSAGPTSLPRRLQRARLRTKILVPILAVAILPVTGVGVSTIKRMRAIVKEGIDDRLRFDTRTKADRIDVFIEDVRSDLLFLSQLPALVALATQDGLEPPTLDTAMRRTVEKQLLAFSQGKRAYYQVRYLNAAGQEVVRLNLATGRPTIVSPEHLQNKRQRYYFKSAMEEPVGQIYTSRLDLNVEQGVVEKPERRVVRYATRVVDVNGKPRGVVIINVNADHLLSLVGPLPDDGVALLVDSDGTIVGFKDPDSDPRAFEAHLGASLVSLYSAATGRAILEQTTEHELVRTGDLVFSTARISYGPPSLLRQLTLAVGYARAPLEGPVAQHTLFLAVVVAFAAVIAAFAGILMGGYFARPVLRLQAAAREVAEGNLDRRVNVMTGDELEDLAASFNTMTERLKAAQDRLASWNTDLEKEVQRQTEHVQQLQAGFSRADKLSTIGQMTATVMHEVGNPLAAIKAKIQVEVEDGAIGDEHSSFLRGIEREVDRLATFLRSFSRLSRLNDPATSVVSLSGLVRDVINFLSPELKRRKLDIISHIDDRLPNVQGNADQLRQVFINLLFNAAEASPSATAIEVTAERVEAGVAVRVCDHGSGMPANVADRVWEPFFTTKEGGTGLGLAICREIVQGHQGKIDLRSEPGRGTIVTVILPARENAEAPHNPTPER